MTAIWEEIYSKLLEICINFKRIHLEFNNFLGRILREIGRLTQLQSLSLINNNILWEDFFEPWQLSQIEASLTPSKLLEG